MTILYVHRVVPDPCGIQAVGPDRCNAISLGAFEELLEHLGNCLCDWRTVLDGMHGARPDAARVGLTFDDAYADFEDVALPVLERHGIRVLLFVTSMFAEQALVPYEYAIAELARRCPDVLLPREFETCGEVEGAHERYRCIVGRMKRMRPRTRARFVRDLLNLNGVAEQQMTTPRMLSWPRLKHLVDHPLVDIGVHTATHPYLPALNAREAWMEIAGAKRAVERRLGRTSTCFAYPYGANGRRDRWLARMAGFENAFSTSPNSKGRMAIGRIDVRDWIGGARRGG